MRLFIIILHFGDNRVTTKCVSSLINYEGNYEEIVIVDNDEDLGFKIYDSRFKNQIVKIIKNKKNLGYAGGMNVGIRYALSKKATHILLLNNDTVIEKEFLIPLLKFLEKEKQVGIVAPAIKFQRNKKTIYDLGGKVNLVFGKTSHCEVGKITSYSPQLVDYVSGCCMLIKREVLEKIGLFDERFFLYYEDVNFCLRAKEVGFTTYILPSVSIFHNLSKTVGKNSSLAIYYQTKSALIFGEKRIKNKPLNRLFIFFQSLILIFKNPSTGISAFKAIFSF